MVGLVYILRIDMCKETGKNMSGNSFQANSYTSPSLSEGPPPTLGRVNSVNNGFIKKQ
jgi:hypothetical protein